MAAVIVEVCMRYFSGREDKAWNANMLPSEVIVAVTGGGTVLELAVTSQQQCYRETTRKDGGWSDGSPKHNQLDQEAVPTTCLLAVCSTSCSFLYHRDHMSWVSLSSAFQLVWPYGGRLEGGCWEKRGCFFGWHPWQGCIFSMLLF